MLDDLNTASAVSVLHGLARSASKGDEKAAASLSATLRLIGQHLVLSPLGFGVAAAQIEPDESKVIIEALIAARLAARRAKDFAESDRIRDELAAMGIALKDGKDADGNPTTTWEVKR